MVAFARSFIFSLLITITVLIIVEIFQSISKKDHQKVKKAAGGKESHCCAHKHRSKAVIVVEPAVASLAALFFPNLKKF
ncbi:MAG: hypothetical protein ACQPRI_06160 [Solitalea-like symbiont of Tyrophagus putrescentiae]